MGSKKNQHRFSIIGMIFFLILVYIGIKLFGQNVMLNQMQSEKQIKLEEKKRLEKQVEELTESYDKIKDPEEFLKIIEKIARDDYKMVKPYETIYIDKNNLKNKFVPENN